MAKNGGDDGGNGGGDDGGHGGDDGPGDDGGHGHDDGGGRGRGRGRGRGDDDAQDIGIGYSDGTQEHLRNGMYERLDGQGRVVERRPARPQDTQRLEAVARQLKSRRAGRSPNGASVSHAVRSGGDMEIQYADGWREEISRGVYVLTDPNGNTVARRIARAMDARRMRKTMAEY